DTIVVLGQPMRVSKFAGGGILNSTLSYFSFPTSIDFIFPSRADVSNPDANRLIGAISIQPYDPVHGPIMERWRGIGYDRYPVWNVGP
ncbi:MAG TPA: hypothetical protein VMT34_13430, partial [Aggregatilineales bacterium]|nr:hypothetical protein [Aggregatilineales bacterium]